MILQSVKYLTCSNDEFGIMVTISNMRDKRESLKQQAVNEGRRLILMMLIWTAPQPD